MSKSVSKVCHEVTLLRREPPSRPIHPWGISVAYELVVVVPEGLLPGVKVTLEGTRKTRIKS